MKHRIERFFNLLSGLAMTLVGGIFLVISLVLLITGTPFLLDPAWITVLLCGLPIVYQAIDELIVYTG